MKLRVLDLFSGIGGFSLGLERTGGFETVAFCEIDEFCQKVLANHWPLVPCHKDISGLKGADVGAIDVICGGFPCQDISVAGLGRGLDGTRSGLWSEYARLIGELRPSFVIVENVAALLYRGMGNVLGDLSELGYDAEWHCIPANAVGAPHARDRVWIIAYCHKIGRDQKIFDLVGQMAASHRPQWVAAPFHGWRDVVDWLKSDDATPLWAAPYRESGGVDDGVPDELDRIGSLGNSVVPQIPELIGRAILQYA